jgi:hypothetical protein
LVVFILDREIRACEVEEVYKLPHICTARRDGKGESLEKMA